MKTLTTDRPELEHRLATLTPADRARWGTMSAHQMLAHLADASRMALGERPASPATSLVHRTFLKWAALHAPVPWRGGYRTLPELDQVRGGGTPPTDFEQDRATVLALLARLATGLPRPPLPHPIFAAMSTRDWHIWATATSTSTSASSADSAPTPTVHLRPHSNPRTIYHKSSAAKHLRALAPAPQRRKSLGRVQKSHTGRRTGQQVPPRHDARHGHRLLRYPVLQGEGQP